MDPSQAERLQLLDEVQRCLTQHVTTPTTEIMNVFNNISETKNKAVLPKAGQLHLTVWRPRGVPVYIYNNVGKKQADIAQDESPLALPAFGNQMFMGNAPTSTAVTPRGAQSGDPDVTASPKPYTTVWIPEIGLPFRGSKETQSLLPNNTCLSCIAHYDTSPNSGNKTMRIFLLDILVYDGVYFDSIMPHERIQRMVHLYRNGKLPPAISGGPQAEHPNMFKQDDRVAKIKNLPHSVDGWMDYTTNAFTRIFRN